MQIIYDPGWNFHHAAPIRVRIKHPYRDANDGTWRGGLSPAQVRRLEQHFCGITECRCNSAGVRSDHEDDTEWSITLPRCGGGTSPAHHAHNRRHSP